MGMSSALFAALTLLPSVDIDHVVALSVPPLSTVDPRSLYREVLRDDDAKPSTMFDATTRPKPTNAWWQNLVLASQGSIESNIFQMPYIVMANAIGMQILVPYPTHSSAIQTFDKTQAISFGAVEHTTGPIVDSWDELSVVLSWSSKRFQGIRFPLVQGSPYITAEFFNTRPRISTKQSLKGTVIMVDGRARSCAGKRIRGSIFSFKLVETEQTWYIFAPRNSQWVCRRKPFFSMTGTVPLHASLHGAVRLAFGSNASYDALLQQHAGRYPVSSSVSFDVSGDLGTVKWNWKTARLTGWPDTELLQLAWPVHLSLLHSSLQENAAANPATPFSDLRGVSKAIVANSWTLTYELFPDVGFRAPRSVSKDMKGNILIALRGPNTRQKNPPNQSIPDNLFDLPLNYQVGAGDTYFSGKMIARLARLIAIADELGESKRRYFIDMVNRLTNRIEAWLRPEALNPLLYDVSWGGVVACGCKYDDCDGKCKPHCSNPVTPPEACPAMRAAGMNFGNAFYNDHHYHYGYFVYAAAVAAKYAPVWEKKWRPRILALIRDYGNPSSTDPSFPVARHKDWFLGFSWAGGITAATTDGRNQESTSEAINAYYAIYAYGSALQSRGIQRWNSYSLGQRLKDLGRVLTAMEVHGADTYWHVRTKSDIYGPDFPFNYPTAGMVWTHMVNHQTYFGMQSYFVEGIHLMPITPVMETYLKIDWIASQFPAYKESCETDPNCLESGFSWQVCLEQALIDTAEALHCVRSLPSDAFSIANPGSNGNSMTNSLHWLATRLPPTPLPPSPPPPPPPSPNPPCQVGDPVNCPGGEAQCAGDQCCPDGSVCPSAEASFTGCPKGKVEDCLPPSQPSSFHCLVGDVVMCPGTVAQCEGDQCCPDGSVCPSAGTDFHGCDKGKIEDCTPSWPASIFTLFTI